MAGIEHHHGLAVLGFTKRLVGSARSGSCTGHAVVGHEDENGVLFEVPLGELFYKVAHVFVDVLDHAVEAGSLWSEAEVGEALGV